VLVYTFVLIDSFTRVYGLQCKPFYDRRRIFTHYRVPPG